MANFIYGTASTTAVFINGVHIDQTYRVDWKETQPKIPIYGYNDYYYSRTIRGRTIVQGFLVLNFVHPSYLTSVLAANTVGTKPEDLVDRKDGFYKLRTPASIEEGNRFLSELPQVTDEESRRQRAEHIANQLFDLPLQVGRRNTANLTIRPRSKRAGIVGNVLIEGKLAPDSVSSGKELFREALLQRFADGSIPIPDANAFSRGPLDYGAIDMDVYYMDPERTTWYSRFEGVEFSDVSQTVTAAGADGSSEPLYETYEYICRRRRTLDISRIQTSRDK